MIMELHCNKISKHYPHNTRRETSFCNGEEIRACFKKERHRPHVWHGKYHCFGTGIDDEGRVIPLPQSALEYIDNVYEHEHNEDQDVETTEANPSEHAKLQPGVDQTDELLASRRAVYGDRVSNMERTAALWSALLGVTIHDWQVPLMMSAYKMLRTFETPDYSDNSDDIDGWKKMFVEVMDANYNGIIKARTVEEYHEKKRVRDIDSKPSGNPYANIEEENETAAVESYQAHLKKLSDKLKGTTR